MQKMSLLIFHLVESWKGGVGRWIPGERGHAGVQAGVQSGLQIARLTANRNRVSAQLSVLCTTCANLQKNQGNQGTSQRLAQKGMNNCPKKEGWFKFIN